MSYERYCKIHKVRALINPRFIRSVANMKGNYKKKGGGTTVFEDTVSEIVINENNELTIFTRNTNVAGMLGEYIFLTKAEAIQALNRRGE